MIKTFLTSFKLKNTYRVNSIIYSIKQLPLIKKILPDSLYRSKGLKIFGNIVSAIIEIGGIFLGKILYLWLMIFSMLALFKVDKAEGFLHILFFLTVIGAIMNTFMFNPTKDKYYAIILMNMDAKKYTLVNYFYEILKVIIGFFPFIIILGLLLKLPLWLLIIIPFFIAGTKMLVGNINLIRFMKTGKATNENMPDKYLWICIGLLLILAYGLLYINVVMPLYLFVILAIVLILLGLFSMKKIIDFNQYKKIYRQLLIPNNVYITKNNQDVIRETIAKQIEFDNSLTSNKNGFAYFHDLFVKRHRKILTKSMKKQVMVILGIFILMITVILLNPNAGNTMNRILLTYLPYFVFVMYLLNRGQIVTQAMFMNCDHSMLTYRIYRTPKVILGLFRERLKTLIGINVIPAIIIAIGLPLLLFISGGTDNVMNYVVLFFSIIAMSIFFSVHYLVMYYLLQPYNVNTELKSSTYKVVQVLTYFVCYYMINVKMPTLVFGVCIILFSVIYSLVSLFIAYKYASKTFHLRT